VCVCVSVCVCVRACVRACVRVCGVRYDSVLPNYSVRIAVSDSGLALVNGI